MRYREQFQRMLEGPDPILALAPMQDVTTVAFWKLLSTYGGADLYVTEYFRVHSSSSLRNNILRCITENPTGRPVIAQLIGNDIPALVRTAKELEAYPIVGVDLNLGCPAPVVYRKCAGGGLLREPQRVDAILGALREAITTKFTVKTRLGFESKGTFEKLLPIFARHSLDMLTVHGRLVTQMNSGPVDYDLIAEAAKVARCPVIANGDVYSVRKAEQILQHTGAKGLMIGRGAIRNPWLFAQFRQARRGESVFVPTGRDVLQYVEALYESIRMAGTPLRVQLQVVKKYLGFLGDGIEPTGKFLYQVKRTTSEAEFFQLCRDFMEHDEPMALQPFPAEPVS